MRVLVACEESQAVTIEFRKLGHEAFSCDILPCSGGHPEWHMQQDVTELLKQKWDLIVAFPPCTYISNAGACRLYPKSGQIDPERYAKGIEAKSFFMNIYNSKCKHVFIENPVPSKVFKLPLKSQSIQPYEHGHAFRKKTYLWLKCLPMLVSTNIVKDNITSWVSAGNKDNKGNQRKNIGIKRCKTQRSKTFKGIAKAIADQYSRFLLSGLSVNEWENLDCKINKDSQLTLFE